MPVFNISTAPEHIPSASLELYHIAGTPYIDFHGSTYTRDYDARIICNATDGKINFNFNSDLTGGVNIQKGGLTITGNETINGHIYITGAHHIYFDSGHSHGIIWRENTTTYAGEALYIGGYFSGSDDSNYLHIQGSTTGSTSTSWHDIMTLTAKSGNLSTSGSILAGTLSTAREIDVGALAKAGSIYFYSASTTNGKRGIWSKNHNGTGHYFLYCTQDNLIHSNAYSTAVLGTCVRDINVQDSASNSVSTKYIIMKRG